MEDVTPKKICLEIPVATPPASPKTPTETHVPSAEQKLRRSNTWAARSTSAPNARKRSEQAVRAGKGKRREASPNKGTPPVFFNPPLSPPKAPTRQSASPNHLPKQSPAQYPYMH